MKQLCCIVTVSTVCALMGCGQPLEAGLKGGDACSAGEARDCDLDGRTGSADCAPNDPAVYYLAGEVCGNGKDDSCNGLTDEGCPAVVPPASGTLDTDGDKYPDGLTDCAPTDPSVNPGVKEVCGNGKDDDCNAATVDTCIRMPAVSVDTDGDKYPDGLTDCAPTDPSVNPGVKEVCGNGKDDDCNAGTLDTCTAPLPLDTDKDGYADGLQDCSPTDPTVHPGAAEVCGNGKDDDCNAATSDTCTVTPPPATSGDLKVKVCYANAMYRTLSVQYLNYSSGQIGKYWHVSATSSDKCVEVVLLGASYDLGAALCALRFNVAEGNPASNWLCTGNGSTAMLDPNATVEITLGNQTWSKTSLITWSAAGGTGSGCSEVWKKATETNPTCLQ